MNILTEAPDRKVADAGNGTFNIDVTLDGINWLSVVLDKHQQTVIGGTAAQDAVVACLANIKFFEVPEFMERRGQSRYKYLEFYLFNITRGKDVITKWLNLDAPLDTWTFEPATYKIVTDDGIKEVEGMRVVPVGKYFPIDLCSHFVCKAPTGVNAFAVHHYPSGVLVHDPDMISINQQTHMAGAMREIEGTNLDKWIKYLNEQTIIND